MSQKQGFWSDTDSVSEYEQLEDEINEVQEKAQELDNSPTPLVYADEQELEEISNESAFDLDEEESNIVYNARLRLEMARLYEMLINHNLFEGVEASSQAVKTVQDEIKNYIVERLEILLGIREERMKQSLKDSDFNKDEADFLKQLAHKGMTIAGKTVTKPSHSGLNPIKKQYAPNKLKSLVSSSKTDIVKDNSLKPKKSSAVKKDELEKPLITRSDKKMVKRKTSETSAQSMIKSNGVPRPLTKQEVEAIAMEDLKKTKNKKPFNKMSAKEKAAEIARVNKQYSRKPVPADKKPPMSFEQQQSMYMRQEQIRMGNSKNESDIFNSILAAKISAGKNQGE